MEEGKKDERWTDRRRDEKSWVMAEATSVISVSLLRLDKKPAASPLLLVSTARSGGASAGINGQARRPWDDPRLTLHRQGAVTRHAGRRVLHHRNTCTRTRVRPLWIRLITAAEGPFSWNCLFFIILLRKGSFGMNHDRDRKTPLFLSLNRSTTRCK